MPTLIPLTSNPTKDAALAAVSSPAWGALLAAAVDAGFRPNPTLKIVRGMAHGLPSLAVDHDPGPGDYRAGGWFLSGRVIREMDVPPLLAALEKAQADGAVMVPEPVLAVLRAGSAGVEIG